MNDIILLIPLSSAFFGAFSNILAKKILKEITSKVFVPINFFVIFFLMTPVVIFSFKLTLIPITIILIILIGIIDAFANYFIFSSIEKGEISHVTPIFCLAPLFTVLFTGLFLPQQFNMKVIAASIAITLSVYILNIKTKSFIEPIKSILTQENYFALIGAILFGLSAIPAKFVLTEYAVTSPATLYWIRALIIALVLSILFKPKISQLSKKDISFIAFRDIFVIIQWILLFYSIMISNVILAVTLANTIPLFTLIMARFAFKEKITFQKVIAIIIIMLAILYLRF